MASVKGICWQAAAKWANDGGPTSSGHMATFAPVGVSPDIWQIRVINKDTTHAATPTLFTVDEDGDEVQLDISPTTVSSNSGEEYTVETKNPKIRVAVSHTLAVGETILVKVKAWGQDGYVSSGRTMTAAATSAAADPGVTLTGDDTLDSF